MGSELDLWFTPVSQLVRGRRSFPLLDPIRFTYRGPPSTDSLAPQGKNFIARVAR